MSVRENMEFREQEHWKGELGLERKNPYELLAFTMKGYKGFP